MAKICFFDREVGSILEAKNVFVTHRRPEHFFRIFGGFGLNKKILQELAYKGIEKIWVFYNTANNEKQLWVARVKDWLAYGEEYEWQGNQGQHLHQQVLREKQLVLNKKWFEVR